MKVPFLNLAAATNEIQQGIESALLRVSRSGYYIFGPELESFEQEFGNYLNAAHCIGLGNGLDALKLGLEAIGVGPGDEVIVPSNTYIATWLAVSMCGAKIVPVEPVEATYNIDPNAVEAEITDRTKVILAVHLYGQPADLGQLRRIAKKHDIVLMEDAAQAHGARFEQERVGAQGTVAFSFYPTKNLGALGDGGALTTDSKKIANKVSLLRNYGSPRKYVNDIRGANSRLDPIQAAVLKEKLRVLDDWNARRSHIAAKYSAAFEKAGIITPYVPSWAEPVWHVYVTRHQNRDAFQNRLNEAGIGTLIHYPIPPHMQKAYAQLEFYAGQFPLAERLAKEVISLPMCPAQSEDQTDYVIEKVMDLF